MIHCKDPYNSNEYYKYGLCGQGEDNEGWIVQRVVIPSLFYGAHRNGMDVCQKCLEHEDYPMLVLGIIGQGA